MNVHRCDACGWETKAPDHVTQVWHPCHKSGRRERLNFNLPTREETTQEWARGILGDSLADAVEARDGDEALYRPLEDQ